MDGLNSITSAALRKNCHPGMTVAAFLPPNGVPRLLSMDRLNTIIRSRLRRMCLASEVDLDCQSDGPGQDFPAPA